MTIPNTIIRTLDLGHPQEKVWVALTTIDGFTGWFGSHAAGEIAPGRDLRMRWEQYGNTEQTLAIQVVDPMSVFAYSWSINGAPAGDPRRTYVEFALEPTATGTRLSTVRAPRPSWRPGWRSPPAGHRQAPRPTRRRGAGDQQLRDRSARAVPAQVSTDQGRAVLLGRPRRGLGRLARPAQQFPRMTADDR
jgi:uncharacterized protein YndB with AHSA1/START domain